MGAGTKITRNFIYKKGSKYRKNYHPHKNDEEVVSLLQSSRHWIPDTEDDDLNENEFMNSYFQKHPALNPFSFATVRDLVHHRGKDT